MTQITDFAENDYPILMYLYDDRGELKAIALVSDQPAEEALREEGYVYDKKSQT